MPAWARVRHDGSIAEVAVGFDEPPFAAVNDTEAVCEAPPEVAEEPGGWILAECGWQRIGPVTTLEAVPKADADRAELQQIIEAQREQITALQSTLRDARDRLFEAEQVIADLAQLLMDKGVLP